MLDNCNLNNSKHTQTYPDAVRNRDAECARARRDAAIAETDAVGQWTWNVILVEKGICFEIYTALRHMCGSYYRVKIPFEKLEQF